MAKQQDNTPRLTEILTEIDTIADEQQKVHTEIETLEEEFKSKVAPLRDRIKAMNRQRDELLAEARKLK